MDKQIEEMAKEISRTLFEDCLLNIGGKCEDCECISKETKEYDCQSWLVAKKLLEKYQPKIPENAVVLTRGDYEKLLDVRADVILKDIDKVFKEEFEDTKRSMEKKIKPIYKAIETRTRKETAEKFAERLKAMAYQSTDWSHGEHPMVVEVDYIDEICDEITEGKV